MKSRSLSSLRNRLALGSLLGNVRLSTRQLEAIQEKKLRDLLIHACRHVPYYRDLFSGEGVLPGDIRSVRDLAKLPVTTKDALKSSGTPTCADNFSPGLCSRHSTSGSTGVSLTVVYDRKAAAYAYAGYERARRENGYVPGRDIFLDITDRDTSPSCRQKVRPGRRYRLDACRPIDDQLRRFRQIDPTVLWGYPSTIRLIAQKIEEGGTGTSVRLVFTAAETLTPGFRDYISSVFHAELFDVYGAWEAGCIAWECGNHQGYHLSMDNLVVEFLDRNDDPVAPGEEGRVVVTNLNSYAMPFIRYDLEDYAVPSGEACPCGRGGLLIHEIRGRSNDYVMRPDGTTISPTVLWFLFREIPAISEFQVVQEGMDRIRVSIVPLPGADGARIATAVTDALRGFLGSSATIDVDILGRIERSGRGKFRYVISTVR